MLFQNTKFSSARKDVNEGFYAIYPFIYVYYNSKIKSYEWRSLYCFITYRKILGTLKSQNITLISLSYAYCKI